MLNSFLFRDMQLQFCVFDHSKMCAVLIFSRYVFLIIKVKCFPIHPKDNGEHCRMYMLPAKALRERITKTFSNEYGPKRHLIFCDEIGVCYHKDERFPSSPKVEIGEHALSPVHLSVCSLTCIFAQSARDGKDSRRSNGRRNRLNTVG